MKQETVLITGASSGIGRATALLLREQGYNVYAAARRLELMKDLEQKGISTLAMDVTDEQSMLAGVERIYKEAGHIDVLINNAGYGSMGALEDVPMEEARYQVEVNLFGLARLIQLVVPRMRQAGQGTIVNISSIGGRGSEAMSSWYNASKYAVEGLSDALWLELKPFGIKVIVIEPGPVMTEWAPIAIAHLMKRSGHTAYAKQAGRGAKILGKVNDPRIGVAPEAIAVTILKALRAKNPRIRYPAGKGAKLWMFLKKHLSDKTAYMLSKMVLDRLAR